MSRSARYDRYDVSRSGGSRAGRGAGRGQAFTLEAFVASLLLLTTIVVVLGSTAVTPLSASGTSQQVGASQEALANGVLDAAAADGSLRVAVLFWDDLAIDGAFHNASVDGDYTTGGPPNEFGRLLNRTFEGRDIAVTVNVRYVALNGSVVAEPMVGNGRASDTGVRAVEWITIYDDDKLYAADGSATNVTVSNATTFYAPDVDPTGPIYNVIQVEVIVWRV